MRRVTFAFIGGVLVATASTASATVKDLDDDAKTFGATAADLGHGKDCLPVFLREAGKARLFYQYCSPEAEAELTKEVKVTEQFTVPAGLGRRFHFWRSVFFLWSPEQYIVHSSVFPDVVLAVVDGAGASVRAALASETEDFQKLLMLMHARSKRRHPEEVELTPAMALIEGQMRHITDENKYFRAARTLRVQRGQRDFIAQGLERASRYLPAVEAAFTAEGLPKELASLAFIESSFNPDALSAAGASGVYQLMPATAAETMDLTPLADGRKDPEKSARAAAKVLKQYYRILGDWSLAVTAYNHGVGGIQAAVKNAKSKDLVQLIDHYRGKGFGFATRNYFAEFLAVLATLKDAERVFPDVAREAPLVFQVVELRAATSLKELVARFHVTAHEILSLNPDLTKSMVLRGLPLPRGFQLKLPVPDPEGGEDAE